MSSYSTDIMEDVFSEQACMTTATEESSSFPSDLSDYRIVFLLMNTTSFSSSEIATMRSFVDDGGVLVVAGETTSFNSGNVPALNSVLTSLGLGTQFLPSSSYDSGCGKVGTVVSTSHTLTADTSTLSMAWTGDIDVGTAGTALFEGPSGQIIAAEEDGVVVLSDFNIFLDDCGFTEDNEQFLLNLYAFAGNRGVCDLDGDGYDSPDCSGGTDCDACDSTVTDVTTTFYADVDRDGFGDLGTTQDACDQPSGYVADNTDCDDSDGSVNTDADEYCDSVDKQGPRLEGRGSQAA